VNEIEITIKLYSGIEKELDFTDYDPDRGIILTIKRGAMLRSLLKKAGIRKPSRYIYFSSGHHVSIRKRFYKSAEVSCLRVSGGG